MSVKTVLAQAAQLIVESDGLLITAGAGIGVDSGLPDFRGTAGFWQAYPALGRARIDFTEIANPQAFRIFMSTAPVLNLFGMTVTLGGTVGGPGGGTQQAGGGGNSGGATSQTSGC